ncbi:MAG TPA: ATP-binding cassette domain-containing protein, partial [Kribbella sp.]|nr:ATP-binding cassette domain-containing protein [Kribbella sp.]
MAAPNLVNLEAVSKGFGTRTLLDSVSLGVGRGERIGVVGRNGDGKSTLLRLIGGIEEPDEGNVTRVGGLALSMLGQGDSLDPSKTVRDELVGGMADHEWAADARYRNVLDGLLGGVSMSRFPRGLDAPIAPLSGGERRRIALAQTLLGHP